MIKQISNIKGTNSLNKNQQKNIKGGFPVLLCEFGKEGQACVAADGQIGQCNSLGICEC